MRYEFSRLCLAIILLLALVLRFYKVTSIPPSLNWDEVSIGYNAYSVLKTGRDEWGKWLPLHFQSYGEYKLPAQVYASIPGISFFGLNPLGVRITPVVYGTLTVLLLYLLTYELFSNYRLSLVAGLLLGVSPWHIQLTRASFESSFSVFWIVLGLWLLVKGFRKQKSWLVVAMVPLAISVYTYNAARIFTPLFLFFLPIFYRQELIKNLRYSFAAYFLFAVLMLPLAPFVLSGEASARYKLVSITNEAGLIPRINEQRGLSKLPQPLPRLVHNKVTYISYYFARNYLAHFTPNFLFVAGAPHVQHHVQGMGEVYKFQAPFILVGLYFLFKRKEKFRWMFLLWWLLACVPAATTKDSIPNALRTLIANPVYQIFTAYGLWVVGSRLKNKRALWLGIMVILLIGMAEFSLYLNRLFTQYSIRYSRDWQYGYRQAVEYLGQHYDDYDLIVFSRTYGEPHMFALFYLAYSPEKYMYNPGLVRFKAYDWVWVTSFDKFRFPDLGDEGTEVEDIVKENPGKKILFIGALNQIPDNLNSLQTIYFLDGRIAFRIADKVE